MTCELNEDCVFGDQQPECDRVQICCNEKLAAKDAEIANLELLALKMSECMLEMSKKIAELRRESNG